MTAAPRHRGDGDGDDREYDCDRSLPPRRPVKAREQTSQAGVRQRLCRPSFRFARKFRTAANDVDIYIAFLRDN